MSPPFVGVAGLARLREAAPRRAVDEARLVEAERGLRAGLALPPDESAAAAAEAAAALAPGLGPGLARGLSGDLSRVDAFGPRFALPDVALARGEAFGSASNFALEPALPLSRLSLHLPDMIRCAASATASAINVPSRDALFITDVAALVALSAASSPASRILRRAVGLAAIAAAAAVNPAAMTSRLSDAFAIRSIVVSLSSRDFLLLSLFAIACSRDKVAY